MRGGSDYRTPVGRCRDQVERSEALSRCQSVHYPLRRAQRTFNQLRVITYADRPGGARLRRPGDCQRGPRGRRGQRAAPRTALGSADAALYRAGRQADALRALARLRTALAEQLGINPSAELVELERSVLAQSADLDYRPLSGLTTPLASPIPRGLGFEPSAVGEQAYRDASDGVARLAAVRSTGGAERSHNLPTPQPAHVPQHLCGPGSRARRGRLAGTVLVTVTGAGGSGKTRLAVAVAARHLEEQGGRAFFVDLAPVVEPGQVAAALASVLGVREQAGRPVLDVLCEALSGQDILVVVDNCEHVIGAAAELGERLNRACPKLRLLATSREPLGIEGERVYRLAPLGLPPEDATSLEDLERSDAVKLFVERAGSHDSTFILEEPVAKLVASICRRLDGSLWPWSWPPPASPACPLSSWTTAWTSASGSSPEVPARRCPASAPCRRPSTGPLSSCPPRSRRC